MIPPKNFVYKRESMDLEEKLYREEIELAPLFLRFCAFVLDKIILAFVFSLIYWDVVSQYAGDYYALNLVMLELIWPLIFLMLAYEVVFLMLYGATLGKMVFKIRVISTSLFDTPNLFYVLIRSIVKIFAQGLFFLPFLFVFFSPFRQTLHDFLAKTIVVKNA